MQKIHDGDIRLNIEDQYVFYVKATSVLNSPNDRAKTQIPSSQLVPKFEVISLEQYVPDKFKQSPIVTSGENSSVTPATVDTVTIVGHSSSPPPAKRSLFPPETAMSPTKKKLNDKLD